MLGGPDVIRIGEAATSGYLAPLPSLLFLCEHGISLELSIQPACQDGSITLPDKYSNHKTPLVFDWSLQSLVVTDDVMESFWSYGGDRQ